MNWTIEYYRDSKDKEPVKEFIDGLPEKSQAQVIGKIKLFAKYGVLLKEPYTRHIKGKIWELRIMVSKGDIAESFIFHTQEKGLFCCTPF
jgi:phage-related protein